MIDTAEWLEKIKTVVVDGICAESEQDTEEQKEFAECESKKEKRSGRNSVLKSLGAKAPSLSPDPLTMHFMQGPLKYFN